MINRLSVNKLTLVTDNKNLARQREHEQAQFFALVANDLGGYDKMWRAMVDLAESALSKSFLDARENVCNKVLLKTADFIDDATPQSLAKDYISRKPDIRIPYSQDATFYRDIKQEMLQEFRKSCFWHILTGGNDEDAENMVVRYLGTPFTFKPKRELA